jgi:hypothetical protein
MIVLFCVNKGKFCFTADHVPKGGGLISWTAKVLLFAPNPELQVVGGCQRGPGVLSGWPNPVPRATVAMIHAQSSEVHQRSGPLSTILRPAGYAFCIAACNSTQPTGGIKNMKVYLQWRFPRFTFDIESVNS